MLTVSQSRRRSKGELAKAYIVPKEGAVIDFAKLEAHCREKLAPYKVPRAFEIVTDLPHTSSGKVMRRALGTLDGNTRAAERPSV